MSDLWRVLRLGRSGRVGTAVAIVLGTASTGAAVALAGVSAFLIARAAEQPPVLHLMLAIVAVRAFGIGRGVLRYAERLAGHDAAFRVLGDVRTAVVRRLAVVLPGARGLSSGELSARFVREVDGLVDLWVRVLVPAAATVAVTLGAVVASSMILPPAGLVLAATAAVSAVAVPLVASRVAAGAQRRVAPDRAEYRRQVLEVLDGASALAVDGRLETELAALDRLDERVRAAEARTASALGLGGALAVLVTAAAVIGALAVGAPAVRAGELDGPAFAVIVLMPLAVHEALAALASVSAVLPGLRVSAARVCEVLDAPDPLAEPSSGRRVPGGPLGLRYHDVAVRWPGGPTVLAGVEVELVAGSTTALVGPSGVGKSSLAAAAMKFVAPVEGVLAFVAGDEEIPYTEVHGDEVRRRVGWCAQDAHVFDSTVRANLALARPGVTDDELWRALAGARLDVFVRSLPQGLDTMVGEHGRALSGGERQRLSLARVLLADASVIVFDEPTEHLDDDTARALLVDLLDATRGRTTLLITHRRDLLVDHAPSIDQVVELAADGAGCAGARP